jgi:hypothetical protein
MGYHYLIRILSKFVDPQGRPQLRGYYYKLAWAGESVGLQRGPHDFARVPARSSMSAKLFVGGLNYRTDDASLHAAFSRFGALQEARVIMERDDPSRSRGFGFVTFHSVEDAQRACEEMHDQVRMIGNTIASNQRKKL